MKLLPSAFAEMVKPPTVEAVVSVLWESPAVRKLFSEVNKLVRIYLTISVTTFTAERSFWVLRRWKTYLRTTMTQKRLNNRTIACVFKARADSLGLTDIAQDFGDRNAEEKKSLAPSSKSAMWSADLCLQVSSSLSMRDEHVYWKGHLPVSSGVWGYRQTTSSHKQPTNRQKNCLCFKQFSIALRQNLS